jgi:hypothetical protein
MSRPPAFLLLLLLLLPIRALADAAVPRLVLDVRLDPASRQLDASTTVEFHGDSLRFSLDPAIQLTRLAVDGRPHAGGATRLGGGRYRLDLDGAGPHRVQLDYHGRLAALADLDHRQVLDRISPMADVRGSFLPAGSGWYPDPGMPFAYRLRLQLPAGQKGLVPGRLLEESDGADYRAEFDYPHPAEGIDLMAGPYVVAERLMERSALPPLRIRTWFHADMADLAEGYLADSARYLDRYGRAIGPYPFDTFSVVASPLPTGFGMPGLTYLGRDVLRLPFIRATSLGHEVLHNWWGNGVRPDWEHGNWSEGLTTFMADYAYQEDQSADAARAARLGWLRDLAAVPEAEDAPLAAFTGRHHGLSSVVGYNKSAMLFLMLRDQLGDDAFTRGLRLFWQRHRFQRAGWAELERAFAEASGQDLDRFFRQWVQRAGAPQLRLAEAHWAEGKLNVVIEQRTAPYVLRVPLRLRTHAGAQETRWVAVDAPRSRIALAAPERVAAVDLDPDYRLWRRTDPVHFPPILREVFIAPRAGLVLADADSDLRAAAEALAGRVLDHRPEPLKPDGTSLSGNAPLLLIGQHASVDALLARLGLPPRPPALAGRGSAQVWAARARDGRPCAVVSARDASSLRALQRALPHYGRQSWLVFESARAEDKGIWPATVESLTIDTPPAGSPGSLPGGAGEGETAARAAVLAAPAARQGSR